MNVGNTKRYIKLSFDRRDYMSWCPKCKIEYTNELTKCSSCGEKLVSNLKNENSNIDLGKEVLLTSLEDKIEAELLKGYLESNNIPVLIKCKGSGEYLNICMGTSYLEVDIFVPLNLLDKAKGVLHEFKLESDKEEQKTEDENQLENYEKQFNKKKRLVTWILISVFILPGILFLIFNVISLIVGFLF